MFFHSTVLTSLGILHFLATPSATLVNIIIYCIKHYTPLQRIINIFYTITQYDDFTIYLYSINHNTNSRYFSLSFIYYTLQNQLKLVSTETYMNKYYLTYNFFLENSCITVVLSFLIVMFLKYE